MAIPKLWRATRFLPYGWKLDLLKALAWPEFEVRRRLVVSDPGSPMGVRVVMEPLEP